MRSAIIKSWLSSRTSSGAKVCARSSGRSSIVFFSGLGVLSNSSHESLLLANLVLFRPIPVTDPSSLTKGSREGSRKKPEEGLVFFDAAGDDQGRVSGCIGSPFGD